jgi:hypothetical protein
MSSQYCFGPGSKQSEEAGGSMEEIGEINKPLPRIKGPGPSIMIEQTKFLGGPSNMVHVFSQVFSKKFSRKHGEIY